MKSPFLGVGGLSPTSKNENLAPAGFFIFERFVCTNALLAQDCTAYIIHSFMRLIVGIIANMRVM